jgi:hypothetical protein
MGNYLAIKKSVLMLDRIIYYKMAVVGVYSLCSADADNENLLERTKLFTLICGFYLFPSR